MGNNLKGLADFQIRSVH